MKPARCCRDRPWHAPRSSAAGSRRRRRAARSVRARDRASSRCATRFARRDPLAHAREKSSIWRLKCSAGRHSSTNDFVRRAAPTRVAAAFLDRAGKTSSAYRAAHRRVRRAADAARPRRRAALRRRSFRRPRVRPIRRRRAARAASRARSSSSARLDRRDHRRLVEHDDRARRQIVEERRALVVRQRQPRRGHVAPPRPECASRRRARVRVPANALERCVRGIAASRGISLHGTIVDSRQALVAALRLERERAHALDRVAEKLDARRRVGARRQRRSRMPPRTAYSPAALTTSARA